MQIIADIVGNYTKQNINISNQQNKDLEVNANVLI